MNTLIKSKAIAEIFRPLNVVTSKVETAKMVNYSLELVEEADHNKVIQILGNAQLTFLQDRVVARIQEQPHHQNRQPQQPKAPLHNVAQVANAIELFSDADEALSGYATTYLLPLLAQGEAQ